MTKEELQKLWESRVNEFKESGKSQAKWCREKGISVRSFNSWYVKFKNNSTQETEQKRAVNWIPLKIENKSEKSKPIFIKITIGKTIIDIQPGFDPEHLLNITRVLSSLC